MARSAKPQSVAAPSQLWMLIAGGGTAGHVTPGLAVAQELVRRGHARSAIAFLGSERGIEMAAVPAAGFAVRGLPGRGLNARRVNLENLRSAWSLLRAAAVGVAHVRRTRPAVVLCLGGYAAFAGVMGAVLCRVPIVVTEQNVKASLANRLAGRFARACAIPTVRTDLPRAVLTGNPVRAEIVEAAAVARDPERRGELRRRYGVSDGQLMVAVMSGSLGARSVNQAVIEMVGRLADRSEIFVHHVIGHRDWQTEHAPAPALAGPSAGIAYQAVPYEEHSDELFAAADLFIGRAGASTVAELAVVGVPAILVPLPIAPRDAQRANAELLSDVGAAVLIEDSLVSGDTLTELLGLLTSDPGKLREMAAKARLAGHPDAAARVADLCEAHASRG